MKKFLNFIKHKILFIFTLLIIFFLVGYFIGYIYNNNNSYYEINFYSDSFNVDYINESNLNSVKDSNEKYSNINIEKMFKNDDININVIDNNKYQITVKYKYFESVFVKSSKSVVSRSKSFFKDLLVGVSFENENVVILQNYHSNYIFAFYSLMIGVVFTLSILLLMYNKKINNIEEKNDYKIIFSKEYWKLNKIKIKQLTLLSMLFALMMVCKFIPIPSGFANLGLSFTYLFFATIAWVFGPIYGLIVGIFSDIIGFMIKPDGIFFLGYTIQASLTGLIYGLCFYKQRINFSNVLISRVLVNMLMNVVLGSFLFSYINSSKDNRFEFFKSYLLLVSLPKNILYLLPQTILLYFYFKLIIPIFRKSKLI